MYQKITDENPYETPMRIFPAIHYTMGGLWVDYNLMTNIPGLYAIGECNFSDHGANRLGASALMQGLADGYFVLPYTIGDYLSDEISNAVISTDHEEFIKAENDAKKTTDLLLNNNGNKSVESFHKRLGKIIWDNCGMSRNQTDLTSSLEQLSNLKKEFWKDVRVLGSKDSFNPELSKAERLADFMELGELMIYDALDRKESCGGHFREEYQTKEGEALRNDEDFLYVSAWEYGKSNSKPTLHKENLDFEVAKPTQRSYK